jgi:Nucleotidyltransferase domain
MLELLGLSSAQVDILNAITSELSKVPGVIAIVLGGSYARQTARPDSDLDLGLYYSENSPPDIKAIRRWAETISAPNSPPTVVGYYQWGPWVNGGAWIRTPLGKLDLLYRNIERAQRVINESQEGLYQHDYYQQPTFGFVSIIYLAEIKCCLPLFDPQRLLQKLKHNIEIYPPALQQKTILNCLTTAEFTLFHAHVFAERGDILNTIGCLTKIAFVLLQSLFALNLEYFFGDKGSLEAVDRFSLCPRDFSNRLRGFLALPMRTRLDLKFATPQIQTLWKETVHLAGVQYVPKFGLTDS